MSSVQLFEEISSLDVLARTQSRVIIGMLLERYEFAPAQGQNNKAHKYKIPITPEVGMRCTVKKR